MVLHVVDPAENEETDGLASAYQLTDTTAAPTALVDTAGMITIAARHIAPSVELFPRTRGPVEDAAAVLLRVKTLLGVDEAMLVRLLGVDLDAIQLAQVAPEAFPKEAFPALAHYDAACRRLLAMFRPERLHRVLRRRVPLFGGSAALDWILQGRIDQVVAEYERTLSYQA